MLRKKVMQIFCYTLCIIACSMTLLGCSKEKPNDAIVTYPTDVSDIPDFKCVCSTDHETEFVIENDEAKALYAYISEQLEKAEQTEIDRTEQDYIYLSLRLANYLDIPVEELFHVDE